MLASDTGQFTGMTITDSDSYTWTNLANSPQGDLIGFAPNTSPDTNATLTFSGSAGFLGSGGIGNSWVFYDISNAAASPLDQFVSGSNFSFATNTTTSIINVPTITPGVNYGLCIAATALNNGPGLTVSSPAGAVNDCINYTFENDNDNFDNADSCGHFYFSTDAPINWDYTCWPQTSNATLGIYAVTFASATLPGSSGSNGSGSAGYMRDYDLSLPGWYSKNS
jgi:hypothetical protein